MPSCADHRCTANRLGATTVTVSLNNGTNGTLSYYEEPFRYYRTPTIYDLYPTSGNATGGNLVTIVGVGFLGFSPNASDPDVTAQAISHLRVRFGSNVQRYLPLVNYSDTEIVCVTPWGTEDTAGAPFSLALNGVTFGVTGVPVRFYYKGVHVPVLVDVYFPQAATTLIIQFDNQATDRAAANGQHPCIDILTASTARTLRGKSSAAPLCEWKSASQLIAYLSRDTAARPGMHVEVLPGLVCAAGHPELCATTNLTWTVDTDFPCDRSETDALEECVQPFVTIRGPEVVGGCPDTPIALDASDYSGGGIRPLSFEWLAHPSKCDNYYAISEQLETQRDQEQLALLTSKGSSYLFMLTATNFLGRKSPVLYKMVNRSSLPIPTVTVLAPALTEIRLRRGASNALRYQTLEGSSSLPDCLEKVKQEVFFSWRNTAAQATAALTSADPGALRLLEVDMATSGQRSLQVYPEQMTAGVRYTFELTGCLGSGVALCNTDTADIILMDSPLSVAIAGGDFATSTTRSFTIDACESGDPDEPDALLDWAWRGPYAVLDDGDLAVNATIAPPHRNQSGCSWEIEAGERDLSLLISSLLLVI
jgi:hypothetical protein